MNDPRYDKLAELLTRYSTELKKGEKVLIEAFDIPDEMVIALIRAARKRGAIPYARTYHARIARELMKDGTPEQFQFSAKHSLEEMKGMQAYIALRGSHNITETADVPSDKMQMISKITRPVLDWRVKKTKWVVLRWPTPAMAQQAGTSTEAFEDFYFRVCTFDYSKFGPGAAALRKRMQRTDRVHIKGPGTDLHFSIKGIPAKECVGDRNIPDGEVFTAPVRNSVNGVISYNTPSIYQGTAFDSIVLEFKDGKVVKAISNNTKRLNEILNTDEGARYIGEFAIGFNPHILHPMRDILFDEKIAGSFHFTPGQAYEETENGNRSAVHWDMVCIQRPDYGGGEIWFDRELIRKDGKFIPKDLQQLNPDKLLKKK